MLRNYGYRFCDRNACSFFKSRPLKRRDCEASGEENRHHGEDEDDRGGAVFHQLDEAFISLLMRRIIVAVSGRVCHFAMLCHRSPQSMFASREELPQSRWEGNGGTPFVRPAPSTCALRPANCP